MAPRVADLMAAELGCDAAWKPAQLQAFGDVAANYVVN